MVALLAVVVFETQKNERETRGEKEKVQSLLISTLFTISFGSTPCFVLRSAKIVPPVVRGDDRRPRTQTLQEPHAQTHSPPSAPDPRVRHLVS